MTILLEFIAQQITHARIPGASLAVVHEGHVVELGGVGVTSVEDAALPVTEQTLFRIGSTTKPLTGAMAMRLVEAGILDLDRPVQEYISWVSRAGTDRSITLRRLLSHTAGMPPEHGNYESRDPQALEAAVRDGLARYPMLPATSNVWCYSNPGIRLVGYIAQTATGIPYAELMQTLLFDPLDMRRTTFDPLVAITFPLALPHIADEQGQVQVRHWLAARAAENPQGGAFSTAADLTHVAQMLLGSGTFRGQQILSAESVREMCRPHADLHRVPGTGVDAYGLTFFLDRHKGIRRLQHPGTAGPYHCEFTVAPDRDLAVILLGNRAEAFQELAYELVNAVFDRVLRLPDTAPEPEVIESDRSVWPLLVGTFHSDAMGVATLALDDGELVLSWQRMTIPLRAYRSDLYFGKQPGSKEYVSVGIVGTPTERIRCITIYSSPLWRVPQASF